MKQTKKPNLYNLLMVALATFSLIACGTDKYYQPPEEGSPETGNVQIKLEYPDTVTGMLLGLTGTVEVRQDLASDGGAPCSTVGDVIDARTTAAEDGLTEISFTLSVGDRCVVLADGWTMHYSDDDGATWSPAIPAGDVEHTTDPHPVPVTIASMGDEHNVMLTFDWTGPEVALGYGGLDVGFEVTTNACSGKCTTAGDDGYMCVTFEGEEPGCYPTCTETADCDPGFSCVRGDEFPEGTGVCNGEAPEEADAGAPETDAGAAGADAGIAGADAGSDEADAGNADAGADGGGTGGSGGASGTDAGSDDAGSVDAG